MFNALKDSAKVFFIFLIIVFTLLVVRSLLKLENTDLIRMCFLRDAFQLNSRRCWARRYFDALGRPEKINAKGPREVTNIG